MVDCYFVHHYWILLLAHCTSGIWSSDLLHVNECTRGGKYFWSRDNPRVYYSCLDDDDVSILRLDRDSGYKNARKLICHPGTYMCHTRSQGEKFRPCTCSRYDLPISNSGYEASLRLAKNIIDGRLERSNDYWDRHRKYSTLIGLEQDKKNNGRQLLRSFLKEESENAEDNSAVAYSSRHYANPGEIGLPSNGCPDLYKSYPNTQMYSGTARPWYLHLTDCQVACLTDKDCIGVDWNKLPVPPSVGRCYLIQSTKVSGQGWDPLPDLCCDHFRKTSCITSESPTVANSAASSGIEVLDKGTENEDTKLSPIFRPLDSSSKSLSDGDVTISKPIEQTSHLNDEPSTIIPDSGCPYALKKFIDRSHPFGLNVTVNSRSHKTLKRSTTWNSADGENDTAEKCKYWCMVRSYCRAVDFNLRTRTCYLIRELRQDLITEAPGVVHYQKTDCAPPLQCWKTRLSRVTSFYDTRVTDLTTPTVPCSGSCFVRQTAGAAAVIERDCDEESRLPLGCHVQGTVDTNFQTLVCYCDTNRCNGLSVLSLTAQMLYLPLDGDTLDHSGLGRHGLMTVTSSLGPPAPLSFTCLDRSVNCSLLLRGDRCVRVTNLGQTPYTSLDFQTDDSGFSYTYVPKVSFVVDYKRISSDQQPTKQGVFGNSVTADMPATWAIYADNVTDTSTAGVITDRTRLRTVEDYKYSRAEDGQWHQHVLSYDGQNSPLPTLRYYVDAAERLGNARLESGNISVRSQPVSVGCVEGLNFIGFIDEVRIFSINLDVLDISALRAMRESNFV